MKSGISLVTPVLVLAICVVTSQLGCGSGPTLKDVYSTNIKKLHACYFMYMEEHSFTGPKDEAEFKNYLKTDPTAIHLMKRVGLTPENIDEVFISDRDGQPFVVRYGLKGEADHAIVFEKTGMDGKRLIAFAEVAEFGNQEYEDWLSGKSKAETATGAGAGKFEDSSGEEAPPED